MSSRTTGLNRTRTQSSRVPEHQPCSGDYNATRQRSPHHWESQTGRVPRSWHRLTVNCTCSCPLQSYCGLTGSEHVDLPAKTAPAPPQEYVSVNIWTIYWVAARAERSRPVMGGGFGGSGGQPPLLAKSRRGKTTSLPLHLADSAG